MSEINLFFKYNKTNIEILENCPTLFQPFYNVENKIILNKETNSTLPTAPNSAVYCNSFGSLLNTYKSISNFFMNRNKLYKKREYLANKTDGGTFALDWFDFGATNSNTPILIFTQSLIDGLCEDSLEEFCRYAYETKGYKSVVLINRGCSGIPITSNSSGLTCRIDDFEEAIKFIKEKHPNSMLFNIGSYIGGTIGLNHLYKYKEESPLSGYVCISNPIDLGMSFDSYNTSLKSKMIEYPLLHRKLVNYYRRYDDRLKCIGTTLEDIKRAKSLREIDQLTTVKMFGYRNVDEYYLEANKTTENFEKLKGRPVLMLGGEQDPIASKSIHQKLPFTQIKSTIDNIIVAQTTKEEIIENPNNINITNTNIFNLATTNKARWNHWCYKTTLEYLSTLAKIKK